MEEHKVFPIISATCSLCPNYRMAKDVAKLADLLGHASIDTYLDSYYGGRRGA